MNTQLDEKLESGYVIFEYFGSYGIIHTNNIPKGKGYMIVSDVAKVPSDLSEELSSLRETNKY